MSVKRITQRVNLLLVLALALGLLVLTACDESEEIITPAPTILSATEEAPAGGETPADAAETVAPAGDDAAYPASEGAAENTPSATNGEPAYPGADGTPVETPYPIN